MGRFGGRGIRGIAGSLMANSNSAQQQAIRAAAEYRVVGEEVSYCCQYCGSEFHLEYQCGQKKVDDARSNIGYRFWDHRYEIERARKWDLVIPPGGLV